jgi:hypothetical protein
MWGRRVRRKGWSPDWGEWVDSPNSLYRHTSGCVWLYIEYWGFRCRKFQIFMKSVPDLDDLDRHVCSSSVDNSTSSCVHWRQWRVCCTSFHHGLHGVVGMVSYHSTHTVYVICYFCYMFNLGPSSWTTGVVVFGYIEVSCERYTPNIYIGS